MIILRLHEKNCLTQRQKQQIAKLIYDTDPFIYPAMFSSPEDAERILPDLFDTHQDAMFSYKNLFVAKKAGNIIGLILDYTGPLHWTSTPIMRIFRHHHIKPNTAFSSVEKEYFSGYTAVSEETVSVINVSVAKQYRGQGVGHQLMEAYTQANPYELELYTLANNMPAIYLYHDVGFEDVSTLPGYSPEKEKPLCIKMVRSATKEAQYDQKQH